MLRVIQEDDETVVDETEACILSIFFYFLLLLSIFLGVIAILFNKSFSIPACIVLIYAMFLFQFMTQFRIARNKLKLILTRHILVGFVIIVIFTLKYYKLVTMSNSFHF